MEAAEDFDTALQQIICDAFTAHQRIIFNGDGYSEEWKAEAQRRGLSNLRCTPEALPTYISEKNIALVSRHGVFTENEFRARHEIHLETYKKTVGIEGRTMVDMVLHQILPAALRYSSDLAESVARKQKLNLAAEAERGLASRISECCDRLYEKVEQLHEALKAVPRSNSEALRYHYDVTIPLMEAVRKDADLLEKLTAKSYWPYPTYSDILYY